ncbi:MAG: hypothetical protein IKD31_03860 [Clostridia bacterium]|nr:hypothetical protein [Clostridia bacterium]
MKRICLLLWIPLLLFSCAAPLRIDYVQGRSPIEGLSVTVKSEWPEGEQDLALSFQNSTEKTFFLRGEVGVYRWSDEVARSCRRKGEAPCTVSGSIPCGESEISLNLSGQDLSRSGLYELQIPVQMDADGEAETYVFILMIAIS